MEEKNEESRMDRLDLWLSELGDLPSMPYCWITQIAYELAQGVTKGFWYTLIARQMMSGWQPHIGLEKYVENRECQTVFEDMSVTYDSRKFGVIVESLALAGFCERTRLSSRNKAWLTPKAFELLKTPQHIEVAHVQKTKI